MLTNVHKWDPRFVQITFLSFFLILAWQSNEYILNAKHFSLCLCTALFSQVIIECKLSLPLKLAFNHRLLSATITSLSICLLIRSHFAWPFIAMPALAIASKFFLKINNKHIFNPANFAIVVSLLLLPDIWISNAFWGNHSSLAIWFLFLGVSVTLLAKVQITSLAFLAFYALMTGLRVLILGFESQVWLHEFKSGALMIFVFFMLSDPKTSPKAIKFQILFAFILASLTFILKYQLYIPQAVFFALILGCLINSLCIEKNNPYVWPLAT